MKALTDMKGEPISFDRAKLELFKVAQAEAVATGKSKFEFIEQMRGHPPIRHEVDTVFAHYLIEELEKQMAAHPDKPRLPNKEGQEGQ